ncbi:MAG: TonB-dependent receptor [Cyclobacteriaceae bacterium]
MSTVIASEGAAQYKSVHEVQISVNTDQNDLINIIQEIETKTLFRFSYNKEDVKGLDNIVIENRNASVAEILTEISRESGLKFRQHNNNISISQLTKSDRRKQTSFEVIEDIDISGKITDENGEGLPGASVVVKGTVNGTTTNLEGDYKLNVPSDGIIVISFVGYTTQELEIGNRSVLDYQMQLDATQLEEIVVVGYGTQKKSDLTGSIATVGADDYKDQPVTRLDQILQGRTPGVNVTNSSGAPGGTVSIRIRGSNSITGSNEPLYVIDGFVGADFRDINAADIETIQVLKDASATAVYGSRGANGVILITTKTGTVGDPKLSFTARYSTSSLINRWDLMDAGTFAEVANQRADDLGSGRPYTDAEVSGFKSNGGTDWQDVLYRTASSQEYQLDYSGGNDKVSYFVSGNYLDQKGVVVNSNFKKYGLRMNVKSNITDKLKATLRMNFTRRETNNVNGGGDTSAPLAGPLTWAPTVDPYAADGSYTLSDPVSSIKPNPLELAMNDNIGEDNTLLTYGSLNYEFIEGLTLDVALGISYSNSQGKGFNLNLRGGNPSAFRGSYDNYRVQNTNNLTYTKVFNNVHNFTATAVVEHQTRKFDSFQVNAGTLLYPGLQYNNITLAASTVPQANTNKETIRSYIGRINYEYDGRYLVTASIRRDGSSKFRGDNIYSNFPSLALGWRLSEESFMASNDFISNLKLRGSWGKTGNQAIRVFGTLTSYSTDAFSSGAAFSNSALLPGITVGNPGNANLVWETTTQSNIGLDAEILQGRFGMSLDYFKKSTTDLLLDAALPGYAGGGSTLKNIGEVQNTGFEIGLTSIIIDNEDFKWSSNLNLSFLSNEVVAIDERDEIFQDGNVGTGLTNLPENVIRPGNSLVSYWGLNYLGTWKSSEASQAAAFGNVPGDSRYEDVNGDGVIGGDDYQIIGQGIPTKLYGWNNSLQYKNFTMNVFFQAMAGYDKWNLNYGTAIMANADAREAIHSDILNRWTSSNETDIPHFSQSDVGEIQSSRYIESGSFVRLKNLSVSYSLPKDVINGVGAQITLSGTNILTITDYKGLDPEAYSNNGDSNNDPARSNVRGADGGSYPNSKTWTLGINFIF